MIENTIMGRELPPKIKNIVENGENFLLLGDDSSENGVFLACALAEFLKAKNKKVFFWPENNEENHINQNHQTEIKIPKFFELSGISYEARENEFVIMIDSKQKIENKDFISVERAKIKLDGVFALGEMSEINEEELKKEFILPGKEKIILIGQTSQISPAGLMGQEGEIQLIGRALARTHCDENLYSSWTFLKASDFEKTKTEGNKKTIPALFEKIKGFLNDAKFYFIFWEESEESKENQSKVFGFVFGKNESSLNFLANSLGAQIQSEYFFTLPFDNFSEAELAMRKLLKKLIQEKI